MAFGKKKVASEPTSHDYLTAAEQAVADAAAHAQAAAAAADVEKQNATSAASHFAQEAKAADDRATYAGSILQALPTV